MIDFGPIFSQLFINLWWAIPLFILAALFNSAWFKGVMGEALVNLSARLFLDKNKYHLIRNVTIPTGDGTTQIDHIIVSRFGVFVVETKNMKGWLFGSGMVLRTGKKGTNAGNQFRGCSAFPKCRTIVTFYPTEEKAKVDANCDHLEKLKFSTALPYAFAEHGADSTGGI